MYETIYILSICPKINMITKYEAWKDTWDSLLTDSSNQRNIWISTCLKYLWLVRLSFLFKLNMIFLQTYSYKLNRGGYVCLFEVNLKTKHILLNAVKLYLLMRKKKSVYICSFRLILKRKMSNKYIYLHNILIWVIHQWVPL